MLKSVLFLDVERTDFCLCYRSVAMGSYSSALIPGKTHNCPLVCCAAAVDVPTQYVRGVWHIVSAASFHNPTDHLEKNKHKENNNGLLCAALSTKSCDGCSPFPPKEMEEFNSIVSTAERMNKQVAPAAEETSQSELQTLGSIHL